MTQIQTAQSQFHLNVTFLGGVLKCFLLLVSVLGVFVASAETELLSDENVPFIYEGRTPLPTPEHKLARLISTEYVRAKEEFTKRELLEQIKPILRERIDQGQNIVEVKLKVRGRLGDYDFEQQSFSTGFSDSSFIPFSHGYAVKFINGNQIRYLPVDMVSAKSLAELLRRTRASVSSITAEVVGVEEKRLNYSSKKIINVRVKEIDVRMENGTHVGKKTISR